MLLFPPNFLRVGAIIIRIIIILYIDIIIIEGLFAVGSE